ncbi:hypothetical protein FIBSPDRAFT_968915 [Athelia psychrophila]|uniref:Uncharacterized protein n=1 Tax=Athelia psychrophila TaxID=1759441 RepID=A0A167U2A7_9AGAM|nr:hypothetical protein FIBSPDRAFT_968915 [Fibularhizoctonia sp. CBS 109695]
MSTSPAMENLQTLFYQNLVKSCTCTRCGHVVNFPADTRQKDINVIMDSHVFIAHPMTDSELTAAATTAMNQPSRFDAPHGPKRNEEERRKILEDNPFTSYVTPIGLHCTPCGKNLDLDKRHGWFAYPYEKHCRVSCKHVRAAEIWQKINEARREEAFFPHSTEHERRLRAADGYNNAGSTGTNNEGKLSRVPKQCWAGGKVLDRYDMNPLDIGHRLSPPPVNRKATVKSGRVEKGRSQRGSSNSSASSTSSTDRSTILDFKAANLANLAAEFGRVQE